MTYTIFGESHGSSIGVVLNGAPAGTVLDMDLIHAQLARRAPGRSPAATARKEGDIPEIISGVLERDGRLVATGAPLCAVIENTNTRSGDYENLRYTPRPSHSDYAASVRYDGHNDIRGGGHFSGRLTAPLVFAGAIGEQLLMKQGIQLGAHICRIGNVEDSKIDYGKPNMTALVGVRQKEFATLSDVKGAAMMEEILAAKAENDSVGGAITCCITGVPAGFGGPDLGDTVEGIFSRHLFAVPAVRGIVFGDGVEMASMRGSAANDQYDYVNQKMITKTNHSGGVNGGITNGMPLVFTVYIRPTPSIGLAQTSVNLAAGTTEELRIAGRHDPCIVPRAVPVVEAAAALALWEVMGL